MGYASTVDTGQVTPWSLTHPALAAAPSATSPVALVLNTTYLVPVELYADCILTAIRVAHAATSAGNVDLGIYDSSGNRLDHSGVASANTFASKSQQLSLSNGNLSLSKGRYYLALWVDNATDTYYMLTMTNTNLEPALANALNGTNPNGTGSTNTATGLLATTTAMGGTIAATRMPVLQGVILGTGF